MKEEYVIVLILLSPIIVMIIPPAFLFVRDTLIRKRNNRIKNKQMNCYHTWRKLDGDYGYSEVIYRYRCEKCKLDKRLSGESAKQFEKDFLSDY